MSVLVSQSCLTLCNSTNQASLFMGFSRQEHWSGLPFPSPENLPDSGIKPWSPALQADSLPFELQGNPKQVFKSDFIRVFHRQGGALGLLFGFRLWSDKLNRFLEPIHLRSKAAGRHIIMHWQHRKCEHLYYFTYFSQLASKVASIIPFNS